MKYLNNWYIRSRIVLNTIYILFLFYIDELGFFNIKT